MVTGSKSAEGAAFNSRGRKAVEGEAERESEARRAGTLSRGDIRLVSHLRRSTLVGLTIHGLTAVAI
jgi:hypothetical protein